MNLLKILKKIFINLFLIEKTIIEKKIIIETNNVPDILLPEKYRLNFQIKTLQEYDNEWKLEVIEKKCKIPKEQRLPKIDFFSKTLVLIGVL